MDSKRGAARAGNVRTGDAQRTRDAQRSVHAAGRSATASSSEYARPQPRR
jgi:hypothetical protein